MKDFRCTGRVAMMMSERNTEYISDITLYMASDGSVLDVYAGGRFLTAQCDLRHVLEALGFNVKTVYGP